MELKEKLGLNISDESFKVVLSIRPHHLRMKCVQSALLGLIDPVILARKQVESYVQAINIHGDRSGYYYDLIGDKPEQLKQNEQSFSRFLTKLRDLRNEEYIEISCKPDDICDSCVIGRHCTGTNYLSTSEPKSTANSEMYSLGSIVCDLVASKHIRGKDFIVFSQTITLQNFLGKPLNSEVTPIAEQLEINALIVSAGALRKIYSPGITFDYVELESLQGSNKKAQKKEAILGLCLGIGPEYKPNLG